MTLADFLNYAFYLFLAALGLALAVSEIQAYRRENHRRKVYDRITEADVLGRNKELRAR